jgi:dihydrofolate reductase
MSKVRVNSYTVSLDGYGAGPHQSLKNPLGEGAEALHEWLVQTATFKALFGGKGGTTGVDNDLARRGLDNLGAWILGRNMFAASRGAWTDDGWKGWWGANPPYHVPVFILTHHARAPLEMEGGTTFHFVTGGIEEALSEARKAAGARDIRIGGGASTIRQYLSARLIDEMHVAFAPVVLGSGESLLHDIDLPALGYRVAERVSTDAALHVVFNRTPG